MALISKLIGNDGYVALGEVGSELIGDAIDDLDDLVAGGVGSGKGFYQVTAIASSSTVFTWTSPKVGDYFWDDGLIVLATGDKVRALPKTADASIKSFEIPLSKDKIDTTVLTDSQKTFRMGKGDASGSMTGVTLIGNELLSDRFIDRLEVASDGTFTMNRMKNTPFYFVGFLQSDDTSGETMVAIVGKVEAESFRYGATDGQAQEFTTGFAPTAGDKFQKVNIAIA